MKRIRCTLLYLILTALFLLPTTTALAVESTTINVGYIDGYGIKSETGVHGGYAVEYLNELAKYTGFTYKFVVGDWSSNLERLASGEIDIIAPMPQYDWLGGALSYPNHEMGFEYLGLYANAANNKLYFDDFVNFEGIKVGAFSKNKSFEDYKEKNGFTASYVFYKTVDEMLSALKRGEIDAYILESTAQYPDVKMIAKLSVMPIHIVTTKDNAELLNKINDGISEIRRQNIYYSAMLHDTYYGKSLIGAPAFTNDENKFVDSGVEIKIAFDPNLYAVELYDDEKSEYVGILPDMVRLVAQKSGINVKFVPVQDYAEAEAMLALGEVDAISDSNHKKDDEAKCMHTDKIFNLSFVLTVKKGMHLNNGDRVGYLEKYAESLPFFKMQFPNFELVSFESNKEMFEAIRSGDIKGGLANSFSFNMATALGVIPDMDFFSTTRITLDMRLVTSPNVDPMFISIFNKGFQRTSIEEINAIIMENTMTPTVDVPLAQILNQYKFHIIALAFVFISLVLLYIQYIDHKNRQRLYDLAYTDPVTGRANYNKFKLDAARILAKNSSSTYRMTKFDLDRFKLFNELFGHESGDKLLNSISDCLADMCDAQYETFARISGDEFIVLRRFKSANDMESERIKFEKMLRETIEVSYDTRFNYGRCRIGAGEKDIDVLYEKANFAHREAKAKSSADVRDCDYDDEIMNSMLRQKELENSMDDATENDEFLVYLQPKYRLADEKIGGAEALVRWQPADKAMIYPNDFIPLFEQNGFITKLDMYMFEKVCSLLKKWTEEGKNPPTVSVNFSRLHLNDKLFVTKLCNIADKYKIPYRLLEIELTESVIFDNENTLISVLEKLHDAGFAISMDDFGSGYSSLGMLKNLPVDVIKLDRSFFVSAQGNKKALAVLTHVIYMARDMEINTVAEGVEEKEHVDLLMSLGCDMVQGYYYAKPMPVSEFEMLLLEMG